MTSSPGSELAPRLGRSGCVHASKAYLICTSPRSGSWLLVDCLEQTGVAGRPREHFGDGLNHVIGRDYFELVVGDVPPNRDQLLGRIVAFGSTPNGVFAAKVHQFQLTTMCRAVAHDVGADSNAGPALLKVAFPRLRFVWLQRRDKVYQAVSGYRATISGQWSRLVGEQPSGHEMEQRFDAEAIARLERAAIEADVAWARTFRSLDVEPLAIMYEDLVDDPGAAVDAVLSYLEISRPPQLDIRPRSHRMRDQMTEEWADRYRAFTRTA